MAGAAWAQDAPAPGAAQDAPITVTPLAAETAVSADARAFRAGLERALPSAAAAERAAVLDFYAARDDAPFWTEAGRGEALQAALAASGEHGLPVGRYDPAALAALLDGAAEAPEVEARLTLAYLRYARDLTGGVLTPDEVDAEINITPQRPEPAALLARLEAGTGQETLDGLAPQAAEYRALIAEKARLEALAAAGGWGETVPDGPALRAGDRDARVVALRARLERLGYEVPAAAAGAQARAGELPRDVVALDDAADGPRVDDATPASAMVYDDALIAVVERFQRDHGLLDDGVIGPRSLAALNAAVEDRIAQVIVNLERMRWLGDDLGARHILVNIPDYTVSVVEDGAVVYHTRSVVGQARDTRTPEFSDQMTYLVVNPTWYIPDSIARRVYLPKLRQDPSVLARNNMRLFTRAGTEINPGLVDFRTLDGFPFRVRQNPSASNALGRVKFMFPNQFSIYLHDTPARELFERDVRAFSNGCVRLEDPFELAHYLLAPQLEDPVGTFRAWVNAGSERYVTLERPIAVHITYRTAWIDEDGVARYREDVYGRDRTVLAALAALGVAIPGAQG